MRMLLPMAVLAIACAGSAIAGTPARIPVDDSTIRLLPWPPPGEPGRPPENLHFRGPLQYPWPGISGRLTVDSASGPALDLTRQEHRLMLALRGEWESAGLCTDTTYTGRFVYRDNASNPRLRGARGTHTGVIGPDGTVHVRVAFDDREIAPFDMKWMPWRQQDSIPVTQVTPEDIRAMKARQMVHPIWPPPPSSATGR